MCIRDRVSSEHVAGPRVLVAEDEALIRLDLVELLQGEGYELSLIHI